ncbi:MAG: hypothetical protein QY871_06880 [Dehalococcoides mccartyi]|uniref:hypothetical protein n=1 Tax=Dehalococcoides mccartyi TaxID=61435 RepID=UPI0025C77A93|nr:hypothetical protein [Dehalococcoides mccartyi]MDN4186775.1 hypothetical protein [Dehalococcoides mccartyi]
MDNKKLSLIADVQCGLVLSRKEAKNPRSVKEKYKRLNLRSLGEDGHLEIGELDDFCSSEPLEKSILTQSGDVVVRLFAPILPVETSADESGFVIPSQLAVIRIKNKKLILPGYLRWYLSTPAISEKLLLQDGSQLQRAIKIGALSDVLIPIPPIEKQLLIIKICETVFLRERLYQELVQQENKYANGQIQKIIGGTAE